jgi:hypothetical protein
MAPPGPHPEKRVLHARLEGWVFLPGMLQHCPQHLCCRNQYVRSNGRSFGINPEHFQQLAIFNPRQAGYLMLQQCCSKPAT